MRLFLFILILAGSVSFSTSIENKDPLAAEFVTSDLDRFVVIFL